MIERSERLGIIGASGWLGRAFAEAVVASGRLGADRLLLSYRTATPDASWVPGACWTLDNQAVMDGSDVTVVSVRPEQFRGLQIDARGGTVLSFMAGVAVDDLKRHCNTASVVRAMPNAALAIRRSFTPWCATPEVPAAHRTLISELLAAGGQAEQVGSESDIDYFTGLTGSGPAFPALLADALARDAVARGLDPGLARRAAVAVVAGAGGLLDRDTDPADTVRTFVEYGGTTAAAIRAMVDGGFRTAVASGLTEATARARAMRDAL